MTGWRTSWAGWNIRNESEITRRQEVCGVRRTETRAPCAVKVEVSMLPPSQDLGEGAQGDHRKEDQGGDDDEEQGQVQRERPARRPEGPGGGGHGRLSGEPLPD